MRLNTILTEGHALRENENNRFFDDMEKARWQIDQNDLTSHRHFLGVADEAIKALDRVISNYSFADHFYPEERKTIEAARRRIDAAMAPMSLFTVKEKKPMLKLKLK